ncbi:MAG: hypothetical protein ACRD12_09665 [Acidimicrobiales bacterium]
MERILGFVIGLVLVCNLAVVTVHLLDDHTSLVSGAGTQPTGDTTPSVTVLPAPGQAFVSGTADRVTVDGAQGEPIPTPFTIVAVDRGVGRLTIDKALVGGKRSTISWDGGTPLPVSGAGGLDYGAAHVEVDGDGPVVSLDGAARKFKPGTYSLGTAVAVGTGGLSTPREGVTFTADDQTVLSSRGNVVIRRDPGNLELNGPGKVVMTGKLNVQFRDKKSTGSTVTFAEGPFKLTLAPAAGGVRVDAILQGTVDVS